MGLLFDGQPSALGPLAHGGEAEGVLDGAATGGGGGARVSGFSGANQEEAQAALLAAEEPTFVMAWPGLRLELESLDFGTLLTLGR